MNAYFFSHHTPPRPSPVPVPVGRRVTTGRDAAPPKVGGTSANTAAAAAVVSRPTSARGDAVPGGGLGLEARRSRPPSAAGTRQRTSSGNSRGRGAADTAHHHSELRQRTGETPLPVRPGVPPASAAASTPPTAALTATAPPPPPPRSVPCLVLFSPQGPRPLEGLSTTTLAHPNSSSSDGGAGMDDARRRAALQTRTNALAPAGNASAEHRGGKQPPALRGAAGVAAKGRAAAPDGVRCVFDRDTRSQLLHVAPGTEVDFSACMRLPALTTASAATAAAGAGPAAVHTIVAVQFCVAAPTPSARHPIDAVAAASPIPPPGSFHLELVLRAGSSGAAAAAAGTPTRGRGLGPASHAGGYRLRFTNTVHEVQRHTHHTKVPLQCVRVAQWVNLFIDLEALLLASQGAAERGPGAAAAAAAVTALGAGPVCRLQQLRLASSGSATGTGGVYVRRVVAGHGLPLPHPVVDHLVTTGRSAPGTAAHATPTGVPRDDGGGGEWVPPEALRLPPEAGESLCVFVRTGEEYVLGVRPALPAPDAALAARGDGEDSGAAMTPAAEAVREARRRRRAHAEEESSPPSRTALHADLSTPPRVGERRGRSVTLPPPPSPPPLPHRPAPQEPVRGTAWAPERRSPSPVTPHDNDDHRRGGAIRRDAAFTAAAAPAQAPSPSGLPFTREASRPRSRGAHPTALELLRQREPGGERGDVAPKTAPAAATAATPTPALYARVAADPSTHSLAFSALSPSSPMDVSSSLTSEDAEHFVVRQVAAAAAPDPRVPPASMRRQPHRDFDFLADTRRTAPYEAAPQLPVQTAACDVTEVREVAAAPGRARASATVQATQRRTASTNTAAAADEAGEKASTSLATLHTADNDSYASDLSVPSYASAVALMEEMQERLCSIHAVLEAVVPAAGAVPLPSPARTAAPSLPPSRALAPPPALSRPPLAPSPSSPPLPPPLGPAEDGAADTAAPPTMSQPPPAHPAAAPRPSSSPTRALSAPPSRPTTAADLMEAVRQGMTRTAGGGTVAATPRTAPSASAAAPPPPPPPPPPVRADVVSPSTPPDPTSILELWNSTEVPLRLPHLSELLTPPPPAPLPHTGVGGTGRAEAAPRVPLAERLRAHQAELSSTSLSSRGADGVDAIADRSAGHGGGGVTHEDPAGPALTPPTSARTSWTFHSAPLPAQSQSSAVATHATVTARRRRLPLSSGDHDDDSGRAAAHAVKPLAPPVTAVEPADPAAPAATATAHHHTADVAPLTRAVVWRRPTTAAGLPPQQQRPPTARRLGEATRRALQDEVRIADTPPSRPTDAAVAVAGGGEVVAGVSAAGQDPASDRVVVWSARQRDGPGGGGGPSELRTPRDAVRHAAGAAGADGVAQVRPLGALQPQQQRGVVSAGAHSLSTVSSFHMWLPSPASAAALPPGAARYPLTTTPSSGGRGGGGPASDSSSAAAAATSVAALGAMLKAAAGAGEDVAAAQRPPAPRLGLTAAPTTRPPLPPSSSAAQAPQTASSREVSGSDALSGEVPHRVVPPEPHVTAPAPLTLKGGQPFFPSPDDAAAAAAAAAATAADPAAAARARHQGALRAAAAPPEGPRYMYDSVLQCYLDLEENAYVERQGA